MTPQGDASLMARENTIRLISTLITDIWHIFAEYVPKVNLVLIDILTKKIA